MESGVDNDPDTIHLKISLADFSDLKSRSRATSSSVPMPSSHRWENAENVIYFIS